MALSEVGQPIAALDETRRIAQERAAAHLRVGEPCSNAILDAARDASKQHPIPIRRRARIQIRSSCRVKLGAALIEEAARIRKKLQLSQRRAGMILGGGENAFQKYEAGKELPTRAMSNLLRLLDNDPARLRELDRTQKAAKAQRR